MIKKGLLVVLMLGFCFFLEPVKHTITPPANLYSKHTITPPAPTTLSSQMVYI